MIRISRWIAGAVVCTLMLVSSAWAAQTTNITVLYTGDTHGHLRSFYHGARSPVGGIAKRAIFFQEKRRHQGMIWLTLDSGDSLSGTVLADVFEGYLSIEAMNKLSYDAIGLGVHDFDFGVGVLKQRIEQAEFPVLSANIHYSDSGASFAAPYVILERDGVRIAILGLTTGELASQVAPANFAGLSVTDPMETAKQLVPQLRSQADVVIALTHLGINGDIRLASEVRGIDVIVGGMSHSELHVPMKFEDTLIVHDSEFGHSVGMLKLSFDPQQNYKRVYFTNTLEQLAGKWVENSDYVEWLASFNEQLMQRMETIVGTSAMQMSETKLRSSETPLGNYVADTMRMSTNTDIALLPAAFFQGPLPEGPITLGDLFAAMPYDHYAVVVDVTGGEVQEILDDAAAQIGKAGFPQISGASFGILDAKAHNVLIGGHQLDLFKRYKLATSDVLADGENGYVKLGTVQERSYTGKLIRDQVRERLATGQVAQSSVYQRISFHAYDPALLASTAPASQPASETPPIQPSTEPATTVPAEDDSGTPVTEAPATAASEPPVDTVPPASEDTLDTSDGVTPAEMQPVTDGQLASVDAAGAETSPATESSAGLDTLMYDRTGQPMDSPVLVEDEIITDAGSDLGTVAPQPGTSTATPATAPTSDHTPPVSAPEMAPQPPADAIDMAHIAEGGLEYVFSLVPKRDEYECQLEITNVSVMPVELYYDTKMKVDFVVMDGSDLVWNYNHNRFYMQTPLIETLAPGETLSILGAWDGMTNDDSPIASRDLRFEAVHQLSDGPVNLRFDAQL